MNVIPAFANHLPVKVRFGEGVGIQPPRRARRAGRAPACFLMVDEGIEQFNPAAAGLLGSLAGRRRR